MLDRTIAVCGWGKIAPNRKTNLTQTPTLTGGQVSSGAIALLPPTLKLTLTLTQTPNLTGGNFPC